MTQQHNYTTQQLRNDTTQLHNRTTTQQPHYTTQQPHNDTTTQPHNNTTATLTHIRRHRPHCCSHPRSRGRTLGTLWGQRGVTGGGGEGAAILSPRCHRRRSPLSGSGRVAEMRRCWEVCGDLRTPWPQNDPQVTPKWPQMAPK